MWRPLRPEFGPLTQLLSEMLCRADTASPFPDLRGQDLFIFSDYGGMHDPAEARYRTYAFLLLDMMRSSQAITDIQYARAKLLRDGRRIAYKGLDDRRESAAAMCLLEASRGIHGSLVVLSVESQVERLFSKPKEPVDPTLVAAADRWKERPREHLIRVISFCSMLAAGFSAPMANVWWIFDRDESVPNEEREDHFLSLFSNTLMGYSPHSLGLIVAGTTRADDGTRSTEDLVSIPDLAAGAIAEALTADRNRYGIPPPGLALPAAANASQKCREIIRWFASNGDLRRCALVIERPTNGKGFQVRNPGYEGRPLTN